MTAELAKVRKEEQDNRIRLQSARLQAQEAQAKYHKKKTKRDKAVKIAKIVGALATTAATTAGCVLNPMQSGHAVGSFVNLANSFFSNDLSGAGDILNGGGFITDVPGGVVGGYGDVDFDDYSEDDYTDDDMFVN